MKVQIIEQDKTVGNFIEEQVKQFRMEVVYLAAPGTFTQGYLDDLIAQPDQVLIWDLTTIESLFNFSLPHYLSSREIGSKIILIISDQQFYRMHELLETGISALLYKPLTADRFKKAVINALGLLGRDTNGIASSNILKVTSGEENCYLKEANIIAVERVGEECRLTMRDGRLLDINDTISNLGMRLYEKSILQLDEDTLINLDYICSINVNQAAPECLLTFSDGTTLAIPLSSIGLSLLNKILPGRFSGTPQKNAYQYEDSFASH